MKQVTIQDGAGILSEVSVSDEVYEALEQAKRSEQTQKRIDRSRLAKESLSDYHSNIQMNPERLMSDTIEEKLLIEQMLGALGALSDYERLLIHKRFYERLALTEIAREFGVTYQAVQQSIKKVLGKLAQTIDP